MKDLLIECRTALGLAKSMAERERYDTDVYTKRIEMIGKALRKLAELVAETADAYCPNCEAYIVNERVTYEECCDTCGTEIEWHE